MSLQNNTNYNLKNELFELIKNRRTVHFFTEEKVDPSVLIKAVELAIWAPNHRLTYPIKLYYLGEKSRKLLADLAVKIQENKLKLTLDPQKKIEIQKNWSTEGEIIVLARKKSEQPTQEKEDYATLACAIQNMSLYLFANGISSKWTTGAITQNPQIYEMISESTSTIQIEGFLRVGYPKQSIQQPSRPSISTYYKEIN